MLATRSALAVLQIGNGEAHTGVIIKAAFNEGGKLIGAGAAADLQPG
jgi:hypothetical protein